MLEIFGVSATHLGASDTNEIVRPDALFACVIRNTYVT